MKTLRTLPLAACVVLAACVPTYTLVPAAPASVAKNSMKVRPGMAWNKVPKAPYDIAWEENWTENGPLLDAIGFIGGLPDGQAITRQRRKADKQVPVFHANMSPQDLVSMVESYYRIKAGATIFETTSVAPATFLGKPGLQLDYTYTGEDDVRRRGRSFIAVIDGKMYLMSLDAAALYYFDAALADFAAMAATASLG